MARCALFFVLSFLAGCGSAASPTRAAPPLGLTRPLPNAGGEERAEGAIELTLRRTDGSFLDLGELRGAVVLVFVFATFDGTSQLALHPLRAVAREHPGVRMIGVAAEPSARLLVGPYEHALEPPFIVTYDPEETVSDGGSTLGAIEAVPTIIVLDRRGVPVARHVGFADEALLRSLLASAGAQPSS